MKKLSFDLLEWAKKYLNLPRLKPLVFRSMKIIKIPNKEEAKKIIKEHSKKEVLEAYKQVHDLFKNKKSFDLQSIKKKIILVAALFVLLGDSALAGLPSVDTLEKNYSDYFKSLDTKERVIDKGYDRDYYFKQIDNALEEIEGVYSKLKSSYQYQEDAFILKEALDKFSKFKSNRDKIGDRDLVKASNILVRLQADAYFGNLVSISKEN